MRRFISEIALEAIKFFFCKHRRENCSNSEINIYIKRKLSLIAHTAYIEMDLELFSSKTYYLYIYAISL